MKRLLGLFLLVAILLMSLMWGSLLSNNDLLETLADSIYRAFSPLLFYLLALCYFTYLKDHNKKPVSSFSEMPGESWLMAGIGLELFLFMFDCFHIWMDAGSWNNIKLKYYGIPLVLVYLTAIGLLFLISRIEKEDIAASDGNT
jgi:hypothetical protein